MQLMIDDRIFRKFHKEINILCNEGLGEDTVERRNKFKDRKNLISILIYNNIMYIIEVIFTVFGAKMPKGRKKTPYKKFKKNSIKIIEIIGVILSSIIITQYWDSIISYLSRLSLETIGFMIIGIGLVGLYVILYFIGENVEIIAKHFTNANSSNSSNPTSSNTGGQRETSGAGAFAGMVVGAAIGLSGGPVGVIVGGILGAIVGNEVECHSAR